MSDDDRTVYQPHQTPDGDTAPAVARVAAPPPPEPETSQALPVGFRLHEFEIQSKLGEGGFGIVYKAWDHSLGAQRAIKEYMPGAVAQREGITVSPRSQRMREIFDSGLKRFMEEAQTLAKFDHPALVRVLRRWEDNGTAYMAMPFYEGTTLRERVRQMPEKPTEQWLMGLLAPLTEAMQVVHQNRWLHRDIAPDNIMLLKDSGRPLLLDFGAARQVIGDVTQELTAILKPGFAPVEQYGETPGLEQGPWTDVYALAASMHWAIMGRTPPPSVSRVLVDNYVPLVKAAEGRYSPRFLAALDKALRVDSRKRTQSMSEFRADLGLEAPAYAPTLEMPIANPERIPSGSGTAFEPTAIVGAPAPAPSAYAAADVTQVMSRPGAQPIMQTVDGGFAPAADGLAATVQLGSEVLPGHTPAPAGFSAASTPVRPPSSAPAPSLSASTAPRSRMPLLVGGGLATVAVLGGLGYWLTKPAPVPAPSPATVTQAPAAQAPAAAPAPTPAPPPAAQPTRFEWEAQLAELLNKQDSGYELTVSGLKTEYSIKREERISFRMQSNRDGYLNVLLRDANGELVQAFTNLPPLRVRAGQPMQIPPPRTDAIAVAEPLGQDEILLVISATPRGYQDLAGPRSGSFLSLQTGEPAHQALRNWKLPVPILAGRPLGPCDGRECTQYGAKMLTVQVMP
ncbi:protein kinase [Inhella sp.]|uniref:protein kinase domain-containing protein n=1 Tax=Inhella sp. TaxID=1921806 RepID=UPI0035B281DF